MFVYRNFEYKSAHRNQTVPVWVIQIGIRGNSIPVHLDIVL